MLYYICCCCCCFNTNSYIEEFLTEILYLNLSNRSLKNINLKFISVYKNIKNKYRCLYIKLICFNLFYYIIFIISTILNILGTYIENKSWKTLNQVISCVFPILLLVAQYFSSKLKYNKKKFIYGQILIRLETEGYNLINYKTSARYKNFNTTDDVVGPFLDKVRRIIKFSVISIKKIKPLTVIPMKEQLQKISLISKFIPTNVINNLHYEV